jgi:adhesin transport system outer membrane protein
LLADIERITYATFEAYQDVAKQRELVKLAEQNLQAHKLVLQQVQRAVDAGVGRQADLDQINGRVALAESNKSTERANLHDVSARYLRIVGTQPPANMTPLTFNEMAIPTSVIDALNAAYTQNPSFLASMRNIESEEKAELRQRANYMPEIDLTGRYGLRDSDDVGNTFSDLRRDARIGIEARFNLYRGGRDAAGINRAMEQINVAKSLRDKSCVDVRQEVQIAFNDGLRLQQELPNLERHRDSSDRVRLAYRDQFDLGQRTLLDLLNAESEYFEASRAFTAAQYDLNIAQARLQANTGSLVNNLGITRDQLPTLEDLGETSITNAGTFCPAPENIDTFVEVPLAVIPEVEPEDFGFTGEDVTAELNVQFEYRSATVRPEFMGEIERLARFMERNPETSVEIAGHASLDGTRAFNQRLSQQRANSVAALLVNRYDIDPRRISAVGYGVTQPIINEISPTANDINRRTEARIKAQ